MQNIILAVQVVVCVLLISIILMQARGSGLGGAFGGSGQSFHSRRGLEKMLFKMTIGLSAIFIIISLIALVY